MESIFDKAANLGFPTESKWKRSRWRSKTIENLQTEVATALWSNQKPIYIFIWISYKNRQITSGRSKAKSRSNDIKSCFRFENLRL